MVLRNSLLGADVAEHVQLLLVFSAHAFFLSVRTVETREFSGSTCVFPQPARVLGCCKISAVRSEQFTLLLCCTAIFHLTQDSLDAIKAEASKSTNLLLRDVRVPFA